MRLALISLLIIFSASFSFATETYPACATQAEKEANLQLLLAIDASGSVVPEEMSLQMSGYAQALQSEEIRTMVKTKTCVAIGVLFWSEDSEIGFPITVIKSDVELQALVNLFLETRTETYLKDANTAEGLKKVERFIFHWKGPTPGRIYQERTRVFHMKKNAIETLQASGIKAKKSVLDVSGDGPDSIMFSEGGFYDELWMSNLNDQLKESKIQINGLPINSMGVTDRGHELNLEALKKSGYADLFEFYQRDVITKNGFIQKAENFDSFKQAIKNKMEQEISESIQLVQKSTGSKRIPARK